MRYIPNKIHIETVNGCNAHCIMCPNSKTSGAINIIKTGIYKKIIRDASAISPLPSIKLSMNGEPLLDKNIAEKIKYAKKIRNFRISLNTNASLLNSKNTNAIIKSGLDRINFHISGFSASSYNNIMQGLNFSSVIKKVNGFIDESIKCNSRLVIAIKFVILRENYHELNAAKKYWLSRGVLFRPDILDNRLGHSSYYTFNKNHKNHNLSCPLIFEQMFIRYNGDVVSCWSDWYGERIFGNCNISSALSIFNSKQFNKLRRLHLNKKMGKDKICSKCNWIDKEKYDIE